MPKCRKRNRKLTMSTISVGDTSTPAFRDAMDNITSGERNFGENGCAQLTQKGFHKDGTNLSLILDIHTKLLRKTTEVEIIELCNNVVDVAKQTKDVDLIKNLFKILFNKRWCRGGEGEKRIFLISQIHLLRKLPPVIVTALMPLYPKYGCYKDLLLLIELMRKEPFNLRRHNYEYGVVLAAILDIYISDLKKDMKALDEYKKLSEDEKEKCRPSLTMAGKWTPRPGSKYDKIHKCGNTKHGIVFIIASELFGTDSHWISNEKQYRHFVTELGKHLNVVEKLMAERRFDEIKPEYVAASALKKYSKAFLNKNVTHPERGDRNMAADDPTRIQCAEKFMTAAKRRIVKGTSISIAELAKEANYYRDEDEKEMIDARFDAFVGTVITMINKRRKQMEEKGIKPTNNTGKIVVMPDLSGSMSGTPMDIAVGLSALLTDKRICHPNFEGRYLSFSRKPVWHDVSDLDSFVDRVRRTYRDNSWGYNTNFEAAMDAIIDSCERGKLKPDDIPKYLLVISDMQFDNANRGNHWETMYENIEKKWNRFGRNMYKVEDFSPPTIIFWNVIPVGGYPVSSTQKGAILLAGESPAHIKNILSGEIEALGEEITPEKALEVMLEDKHFDPIEEVLDKYKDHIKIFCNIKEIEEADDYEYTW